MKKIILLFSLFMGAGVLCAQDTKPEYNESAIATAIAGSDFAAAQKLLHVPFKDMTTAQKNHLNHFFVIAAETCDKRTHNLVHETLSGNFDTIYSNLIKCDKAQNTKILAWLLSMDQVSNSFVVDEQKNEKTGIYSFDLVTPISRLKENNPEALRTLLPKLDKCTIALTQMQAVHPNDTNYHVYADAWRANGCSLSKIKRMGKKADHKSAFDSITWDIGIEPLEKAWFEPESYEDSQKDLYQLVYETGVSRADLLKTYGNPTYYESPYDFREIFTYRRMVPQREKDSTYYKIADYIYTLDRGVVTHVQYKLIKGDIHYSALALQTINLDEFKKKGY